jgi:hypothetical protein
MIRRIVNVVALVALVALVVVVYRAKTEAEADHERAAALAAQLASEREAITVVRTEIGFLERPDRLRALAERRLGLKPIDPLRVVTLEDAPLLIENPTIPSEAPPTAEAAYLEGDQR